MSNCILIVGSFPDEAPLERYVSGDLAERLRSRGWGVWTTSRKQHRLARLADMLKTVWSRKHDYSVALVDVFSGSAFIWAEAVAGMLRRLAKPYVLTLHGGGLPEFAARWPGRVRSLLHSASAVTSPSGYLQHHLAAFCPNIRLVPNPIQLCRYPYRPRSMPEPRVIWLRAFHEVYNPLLAIEVFEALASAHPRAVLTMAGPDKGDQSLQRSRAAAAKAGLASKIHFMGPLAKTAVPAVLSQNDIFLNTTNVDNTPVSVIEAMACGLCVVSTNVGGLPYLLENGVDSLLVPPRDKTAMLAAVKNTIHEASLARRLSTNARKRAEQFDWSVVLPIWTNLFEETLRASRSVQPIPAFASHW